MLSKLLKYEFKSTARLFLICYAAILVLAVVMRFMVRYMIGRGEEFLAQAQLLWNMADTITGVLMTLFVCMIIGIMILTFILIIVRFWRNLLGGEGYLMMTLPVPTWQLTMSKLIAAMVWSILSAVVITAAIVIVALDATVWHQIVTYLPQLIQEMQAYLGISFAALVVECIITMLLSAAASILQLYVSMMIGSLFQKHRVAGSVLVYVGINIGLSVVVSILMTLMMFSPGMLGVYASMNHMEDLLVLGKMIHGSILISLIISGIMTVGFYALTNYLMRHHLNLE